MTDQPAWHIEDALGGTGSLIRNGSVYVEYCVAWDAEDDFVLVKISGCN